MNKQLIVLSIALFLIFEFMHFGSAEEECFPNYVCQEWTECQDGFKTRTCVDTACGNRDVIERSFCTSARCTPRVECGSWSECTYTEKTDNLIKGKIGFGGYRTRVCDDLNDCIPRFIQEGPCEDSYKLQLSPIEECDQSLLAVIDPVSDRKIAKINLERWKEGKFDLAFVQGEQQYCPSCYNAVKDSNEDGVDCGGSCKPCGIERPYLLPVMITLLWICSLVFTFLSFHQYFQLKKPQSIFIEQ
jgi:hypothetical protein